MLNKGKEPQQIKIEKNNSWKEVHEEESEFIHNLIRLKFLSGLSVLESLLDIVSV